MANRIFFSFLAMIITIAVYGQEIALTNLTISQKESKTLFIGVDNKFKVEGIENIQKIESSSPVYSTHLLREDTLIIRPHAVGSYTLTFHTNDGSHQVNFVTKTISDVSPAVGIYRNGDVVDKKEIIAQGMVSLSPYQPDEIFFENYKVSSFKAQLGDRVFTIVGDKFTDKLIATIKQAKSGDTLILTSVKATNVDIGKTINSNSKYSFTIK